MLRQRPPRAMRISTTIRCAALRKLSRDELQLRWTEKVVHRWYPWCDDTGDRTGLVRLTHAAVEVLDDPIRSYKNSQSLTSRVGMFDSVSVSWMALSNELICHWLPPSGTNVAPWAAVP